MFAFITPYKPGAHLLSNANTNPFNRQEGKIVLDKFFADCVEMAMRHVTNLLLYDADYKGFNLKPLHDNAQQRGHNPYFKNFVAFYAEQTPDKANAGNITIRSLWNTGVGDLNALNEPGQRPIVYVKKDADGAHEYQYELETGFINFIAVFDKIFGLNMLSMFPQGGNLDAQKEWLGKSLEILFKTINPKRIYKIENLATLQQTGNELSGTLMIVVSEAGHPLFSFDLYSMFTIHSAVTNLQALQKGVVPDYEPLLVKHLPRFVAPETTDESLWLMSKAKATDQPLYQIFQKELADSEGLIKALETIYNQKSIWPMMLQIVPHILENIPWNDPDTVKKITPVILNLLIKGGFNEVLYPVKALNIDIRRNKYFQIDTLKHFVNLEDLSLIDSGKLEALSLENNVKLKNLKLETRKLQKIEGLERLVNLEALDLSADKLKTLSLENNIKIKKLDLNRLNIHKVDGLERLVNLEKLALQDAELEMLSLEHNVNLKELDLFYSNIQNIKGLEHLVNLKKLELTDLKASHIDGLEELKKERGDNLKVVGQWHHQVNPAAAEDVRGRVRAEAMHS